MILVLYATVVDDRNCSSLNNGNRYDIWLSVKSSVDNSGSVFIYSYEEQECVSAKVLLHTSQFLLQACLFTTSFSSFSIC